MKTFKWTYRLTHVKRTQSTTLDTLRDTYNFSLPIIFIKNDFMINLSIQTHFVNQDGQIQIERYIIIIIMISNIPT